MCDGEEGGRGRKERESVNERERVRTQRRRSRAALHHHATHRLLMPIPSGAASDATMQRRKGRGGRRERQGQRHAREATLVSAEDGKRAEDAEESMREPTHYIPYSI